MRMKYDDEATRYLAEVAENVIEFDERITDFDAVLNYVNAKPTYLEIGPGKGQFIISMAQKHKEVQFLIVEISSTVAGICIRNVNNHKIENVKMNCTDFYNYQYFEPGSLYFEGIFLNFSDPWPKKKYAVNRLTHPKFIFLYNRFLKVGGRVYFKTDNEEFGVYSREMFEKYKWKIVSDDLDYKCDDKFDVKTEFEEKYTKEGKKIRRIVFEKTEETLEWVLEEDFVPGSMWECMPERESNN